jgi:sphingolipid delta-4 desaturase
VPSNWFPVKALVANLAFHLQITKLCGPEPLTKWVVLGVVSLQVFLAWMLQSTPFFSWKFWAVAYVFGATANQNLFLAIHEISHNLAFRSPRLNRLIAIFANLPIGIPYSASFRVCNYELSVESRSITNLCLALPSHPPQVPRR